MGVEKGRLGQFFVFLGLLFLIIFFAVDQSQNPQLGVFLFGVVSVCLGIYLIVRDFKSPPESQRFRGVRKYMQTRKEKKKEKEKKKLK